MRLTRFSHACVEISNGTSRILIDRGDLGRLPEQVVGEDDRFDVGALGVEVVSRVQAVADLNDPPIPNIGYLVDGTVLHPGDAHQLIEGSIGLLVPMSAPW